MKRKTVKLKSEKITIILLLIVGLVLISIACLFFFVVVDETGYFASEEQSAGSEIDTNSINLSYLDENSSFTYPLAFSEQDIQGVKVIGDNVYVLTSKTLVCLSDEGNFVFAKVLNYSSPVIYANSKYGIVYDEIGGYYIVFDEEKVIYEAQIDTNETFLIAQVDEYANILLVTKSSEKSSIFYMYDKDLELIRSFAFTQDYIVSMDIYNQDKIVFVTIGSNDGYFNSNLYVFDMDSTSVLASCELGSEAVVNAQIISDDYVSILTSSSVLTAQIVNDSSVKIIGEEVITGSLLNYRYDDKGLIIASQDIDELNETTITYYNTDNNLAFQTLISNKSLDIYSDSNYVYILTSQMIYVLNFDGSIHSELSLIDSAFGLVASTSGIYHYSIGVLHKNEYKLSTQ